MTIIDLTYYTREILIAQRAQPEVAESIASYTAVYEPELLIELLGKQLYEEFIAGLSVVSPIVVDPKWVALRGWLRDATKKISPIANYVFVKYTLGNVATAVGTGYVVPLPENSERVSATPNVVWAWNKMIDLLEVVHTNILENIDDYPDYAHRDQTTLQNGGCGCDGKPNFFTKINRFGL